jgi:hypothetical protein
MAQELDLARDVLDKQLVDSDDTKMGRVDGIVLAIGDGAPRIDHFELGFSVLARRLHPRVEQWLQVLRRWSPRRTARQIVPWSAVQEINSHEVRLDLKAIDTPAFDWERWLRRHIVSKIPGCGETS